MSDTSGAYIVALVCLLLMSAFFSASETAFSSLNRIRLKSMAAAGDKKAEKVLKMEEQYDKLLSTILIGNNIVNILSSSLATVLFVNWLGNKGVSISTVVMTILVLLVGEITPKTLAKEVPEKVAMSVAPVLSVFVTILTPINAVFSAWKKLLISMFNLGNEEVITEEELLTYVEQVREDGTISGKEEDMIRSLIEFDDSCVSEVCTPRVDVSAISIDDDNEKISNMFLETGYSRLPVYEGSLDKIVGVLLEKDFHYDMVQNGKKLEEVMREILHVMKTVKISKLLSELQHSKFHMAIVVDEFGGTFGLVTIEDIIEELVGEIWDEHDMVQEDILELEDGIYRVEGGANVEEFFDLFGIEGEEKNSITVGGWLMEEIGYIPKPNERIFCDGLIIDVENVEHNRIISVIARREESAL